MPQPEEAQSFVPADPPAQEFISPPSQPPSPQTPISGEYKSYQAPPPAGTYQTPPTGEWQAPPPPPPPSGQYQQGYYQPYQAPQAPGFNKSGAKADFEKSKGLFLDMINAHKADAEPSKEGEDLLPRRYPALKLFMTIQRILAWIVAGFILLTGVITFFARIFTRFWWQGLIALPISVIAAFLALAVTYMILDVLRLFINIEDNTRRSANK